MLAATSGVWVMTGRSRRRVGRIMLRVGITGSGKGYTWEAESKLSELMSSFRYSEFHHGDCKGVDELGHKIALEIKYSINPKLWIVIHPPIKDAKRAFCIGANEVREPKPYLDRDEDIAAESDLLIALPEGPEESYPRSGTWATVNRARKRKTVLIIIISQDGSVEFG